MLRVNENSQEERMVCNISERLSCKKMIHAERQNILIVPDHGSAEVGKGLEKKILKDAGIK
jgi:mRNA interferase HicA